MGLSAGARYLSNSGLYISIYETSAGQGCAIMHFGALLSKWFKYDFIVSSAPKLTSKIAFTPKDFNQPLN